MLKRLANLIAAALVLPAFALYRAQAALVGRDRAFPGWSQCFALLPGTTGVFLRRAFYRFTLKRCGDGATIGFGTVFSHPSAELGRNVYVGNYGMLGGVTIEDDCLLASHVSVLNGLEQHAIDRLDVPIREQPGQFLPVTIGRDCWIGERAVVAADVGPQCVVGAGAVVTKPLPDRSIAVGVPAKVIRTRESREPEAPARTSPKPLANGPPDLVNRSS